MKQDNDIFIQQIRKQIQDSNYPHEVDVVDSVMDRIGMVQTVPTQRKRIGRSIIISAAASLLILIGVYTFVNSQPSPQSDQLGTFIAETYGASYNDADYSQATCASAQLAYAFI